MADLGRAARSHLADALAAVRAAEDEVRLLLGLVGQDAQSLRRMQHAQAHLGSVQFLLGNVHDSLSQIPDALGAGKERIPRCKP